MARGFSVIAAPSGPVIAPLSLSRPRRERESPAPSGAMAARALSTRSRLGSASVRVRTGGISFMGDRLAEKPEAAEEETLDPAGLAMLRWLKLLVTGLAVVMALGIV